MSTFKVEVVRLGDFQKHPDADTLSITNIFNYPVIFQTESFKHGDLVAYVPVESIVPDTPEWAFLGGHNRIKAKRLRGIFSMGLLTPAPPGAVEGDDVAALLGITKYEEPESVTMGGERERDPGCLPRYTDIEGYLRYGHLLDPSQEYVIKEKLHGSNWRGCHDGEHLHIGSHRCFWKETEDNLWWRAANQYNLKDLLAKHPGLAFYAEVYGSVQDLTYGLTNGKIALRFFGVLDTKTNVYLDSERAEKIISDLGLDYVPELYRGPLPDLDTLWEMASGKSTIADNIREGIVITPLKEQSHPLVGRVIMKLISKQYLERKKKGKKGLQPTEAH